MEICSSVDGLNLILNVTVLTSAAPQNSSNGPAAESTLIGDQANLTQAVPEVSPTVGWSDVRMDKVAVIQAALAAGTYNVPASAVASKVVDTILRCKQSF